jgi:hypothetical protein
MKMMLKKRMSKEFFPFYLLKKEQSEATSTIRSAEGGSIIIRHSMKFHRSFWVSALIFLSTCMKLHEIRCHFKEYLTAETAVRRDYFKFSFSAFCELRGELLVSF